MILDFLRQLILAGIFFAGISLGGLFFFSWLKYEVKGKALEYSLAYFISLSVYTALLVGTLFIFADKKLSAILFTLIYFIFALGWYLKTKRKLTKKNILYFKENKAFLAVFLLSLFSFWLQIYHTSMLDEWLHRPVTQEFIDFSIFPLVNPLQSEVNFINTYHYGTQLVSGTIGLTTNLDASESLDIFKLANAIASLLLLYGIVLQITQNKKWSVFGMATIFFLASSFFLLDSFTASHLKSFSGLGFPKGERWPINVPLSFGLTGVTWVNIPLMLAWVYFLDSYIKKKIVTFKMFVFSSVFFIGFFLISELFAVLGIVAFCIALFLQLFQKKIEIKSIVMGSLVFVTVLIGGLYFTGGIVGSMVQNSNSYFNQISENNIEKSQLEVEDLPQNENESKVSSNSFLELKPVLEWGYPTESRTLFVSNHPIYYLRTFFLEILTLLMLSYLIFSIRKTLKEYPVLITTTTLAILLPLAFHTSFGDLNLYKLTIYGLLVLHLSVFLLINENSSRWIKGSVIFLLITGSIAGFFLGPNIQWRFISGKGKSMYCSQNPSCYSGNGVELLKEFEKKYPDSKTVTVSTKDIPRVVDLTYSHVSIVSDSLSSKSLRDIDFIYNSPELRKNKDQVFLEELNRYKKVLEKGEYSILMIK